MRASAATLSPSTLDSSVDNSGEPPDGWRKWLIRKSERAFACFLGRWV